MKKNSSISHQHKCIFIHVPRTGGMSIKKALKMSHLDDQHQKIVSPSFEPYLDAYFKFGFVRNPWDRMVSHYFFAKKYVSYEIRQLTFDEFVKNIQSLCIGRHYGVSKLYNNQLYMVNQIDWLTDPTGKVLVDFIGRFENMQSDFDIIQERLKTSISLPCVNKSDHEHYTSYYTDELIATVKTLHQKDIDYFGYTFEGGDEE